MHLKTHMNLIAGWGIELINVMSVGAYCSQKSSRWHHFYPWLLFQKGGHQGVTGKGRFTWHWDYLSLIMFLGLLLIAWAILAQKKYSFGALQGPQCVILNFHFGPWCTEWNPVALLKCQYLHEYSVEFSLIIIFFLVPLRSWDHDTRISAWFEELTI